jgi:hypothetical protein
VSPEDVVLRLASEICHHRHYREIVPQSRQSTRTRESTPRLPETEKALYLVLHNDKRKQDLHSSARHTQRSLEGGLLGTRGPIG